MSDLTDRKCVEKRERQARDRLLRHYRKIGAPAIAAALDVSLEARKEIGAETAAGERKVSAPGFLLSDDHAA